MANQQQQQQQESSSSSSILSSMAVPSPTTFLPSSSVTRSPPSTPPQLSNLDVSPQLNSQVLSLRLREIPLTPSPSPQPFTSRRPSSSSEWSPAIGINNLPLLVDDEEEDELTEEEKTIEIIRSQFSSMTSLSRQRLLSLLVTDSSPSLLSPLLPLILPRLKRDFLKDLPVELAFQILGFIQDVKTLQRASGVSLYWRGLISDETYVWKRLCWTSGFGTEGVTSRSTARNNSVTTTVGGGGGGGNSQRIGSIEFSNLEFGEREEEEGTPAGRERRGTLDRDSLTEFAARAELFGLRIETEEGSSPIVPTGFVPFESSQSLSLDSMSLNSDSNAPSFISSRRRTSRSIPRSPLPLPSTSTTSTPVTQDSTVPKPFSYKTHFKRAYLTESNWIKPGGGRLLSTQMSTDDGVVTSLGFDNEWIVVGMATSKVHIFDAIAGTYRRTLEGHELGVWCLTLVSKGGGPRVDENRKGKERGSEEDASCPKFDTPVSALRAQPLSARRSADGHNSSTSTTSSSSDSNRAPLLSQSTPRPSSTSSSSRRPRRQSNPNPSHNSSSSNNFPKPKSGGMGLGAGGETGDGPQQAGVCGTARGYGQTGALVVSAGCDRDVRVWEVETGECLHILRGHVSTVRCMRVIDGRPIAVSGSRDATLRVWNIETGEAMHVLSGHSASVRCIEVSGNKVVSGSYDTTCRLWDVDTGECVFVFRGHDHQIYSCAFDGLRVVTGSLDSTVRIWSAVTGEFLALLQGHTSLVGQLQLDPVSNVLITGGSDGRVISYNIETYETYFRLCAHDNSVTCLQFDERFIVTGGNDGAIMLWDFKTGAFIRELAERCDAVWKIAFRDDQAVILCRREGKTLMDVVTFVAEV